MALTKEDILRTLKENVVDPELNMNIVDLGLVYGLELLPEEKTVRVTMTLTSPACPIGPLIIADVKKHIHIAFPELDVVDVNLVFTPMWTPAMMSEEAKDELGIF